jgi:hypothetical protein
MASVEAMVRRTTLQQFSQWEQVSSTTIIAPWYRE